MADGNYNTLNYEKDGGAELVIQGQITIDGGSIKKADGTVLLDETGSSTAPADGSVTTAKIVDLNVTTGKLAAKAVTTAKIDDLAVTAGQLGAKAATTAKIDDGAVTVTQLGTAAVETAKIKAGNVTPEKMDFTGIDVRAVVGRATPGACTATGMTVGQRIVAIFGCLTAGGVMVAKPLTDFEATVSVGDQLQQATATDLHLYTFIVIAIPAAA